MTTASTELFEQLSSHMGAGLVGDPYAIFAERRATSPVMEGDIMAEFGLPSMAQTIDGSRSIYTLFRYDDISAALRDGDTFSSSLINEVFERIGIGRRMLGMDGSEHRAWKGMVSPAFTRRAVDYWHHRVVRPVARELVAELAASGQHANLVDFALRFPVRMIYAVLGFPDDPQVYDRFARSGLTMSVAVQGVNASDPEQTLRAIERARAACEAVTNEVAAVVEAKAVAGAPGDDLISHLLRSEVEGERMTNEQIVSFVRGLLAPAAETTTRSWLNVMACLLERPAVVDRLREDRSLILPVIDEGLRLESSTTVLGRITTREVELHGVRIPAGSGITLATGSANRDETVFDDPDVYDIDRRQAKPALNFGLGPHFCPGMQIAKLEMSEAISALLDLLPGLRLDPDEDPPTIRGMMLRCPSRISVVWDA